MSQTNARGSTPRTIGPAAYEHALALRDLSDAGAGGHAMQQILDRILEGLHSAWGCEVLVHRAHPLVSVSDNYDALHYAPDAIARDARYARYVSESTMLRTHTTAMIPPLLRRLAVSISDCTAGTDVVLACAGLVYRRDSIDRLHTGEPHQLDLWRIRDGEPLTAADLSEMMRIVAAAALSGVEVRCVPAEHPYTVGGLQVDACIDGPRVEIAECGLALPALLDECGLQTPRWSGLAMGIGLDRLLMLAKGMDDIRLLRSEDPRIAAQMLDLEPYRPVSSQPAIRRDLSVAMGVDVTSEEIGDRVREAMTDALPSLESIEVLSETSYEALPDAAIQRIGIRPGQKNVLLRLVIRDVERTLTSGEANELRDRVYAAVHEGDAWQWATGIRDAP